MMPYSFQNILQAILSSKKKYTIFLLHRCSYRTAFLGRKKIPYSFQMLSCRTLFLRINKKIFHVPSSSSIYLNGISIVTLYLWLINKSKWGKNKLAFPANSLLPWQQSIDDKCITVAWHWHNIKFTYWQATIHCT